MTSPVADRQTTKYSEPELSGATTTVNSLLLPLAIQASKPSPNSATIPPGWSQTAMTPIPQEIMDRIIDEVDALDAETSPRMRRASESSLISCSLAASMFLEPSQRRLFQSLHLPPGSKKLQKVTESPHLGRYVRDLNVSVDDAGAKSDPDLLASVLRLLVGVQRLIIFISSSWCNSNFTANYRDALISLLSLPSLRSVTFYCTGVPSSLILHALACCKEVGLHMILEGPVELSTAKDDDRLAFNSNVPPNALLARLVLDYIPEESPELHNLFLGQDIKSSLEKLRYLEINAGKSSLGGFESLVLKYAHSLHHLAFNFFINLNREAANAPPFELPSIPTLRFLTFKTDSEMKQIQLPNSLMSTISSLPTCMPQLEVLTFEFEGKGEGRARTKHRADADKALKSLPHLRQAQFIVVAQAFNGNLEHSVRQQLPLSSAANLIIFSYIDYPKPQFCPDFSAA
ncbi:hypothetical protein DFH06DRAFT_1128221 [Mycena polygramma]|nr:hypothetical protein DFH06DRAFT_1128221 [Mycena polygramma]